jgi:hypothetical protein
MLVPLRKASNWFVNTVMLFIYRRLQKQPYTCQTSLSQMLVPLMKASNWFVNTVVLFIYSAKACLRGKTRFCLGI